MLRIYRRLIVDFWINYYTTSNLARQQLFCNLEVGVGIEPTNNSFADCDITILSSHYNSGTACRNRTYILSLEDLCPVHWTNAVLVRVERLELSIPKATDFKSAVFTYFTILAINIIILHLILHVNWYSCWDSNSENLLLLRETTLPICPQEHSGGLTENWTQTQPIMSRLLYH